VPAFAGGLRLAGWKRYKDNIYAADLPAGAEAMQLFEDARRMSLARAPNAGYFKLEKGAEAAGKMAFVYSSGDIDPLGWDVSEAISGPTTTGSTATIESRISTRKND